MLSIVMTRTLRSFGGPGGAAGVGGGFVGGDNANAADAETAGVGVGSTVGTACVAVIAGDPTGLGGPDSPPLVHAEAVARIALQRSARSVEKRIEGSNIAAPF